MAKRCSGNKQTETKTMLSSKQSFQIVLVFIGLAFVVLTPTAHFESFSKSITDAVQSGFQITTSSKTRATQIGTQTQTFAERYTSYIPAESEEYILNHTAELGLIPRPPNLVTTCHIWTDNTTTPYNTQLIEFNTELAAYYKKVDEFTPIKDLRSYLFKGKQQQEEQEHDEEEDFCQKVELHPDGLPALFPSGQISLTRAGWVEPLLPQMRHPNFCLVDQGMYNLMRLDYMVHDFGVMCQNLKPWSRTIFVDLGASLSFHTGSKSPALFILDLYRKFGFPFDHVYAFELTQQDPKFVLSKLPENILASYHWINVGVDADPNSKANPWKLLKDNYNEDDLIVVKLDIDTPDLERALADQFLGDPDLMKLVDQFYFEHHVNQQELARHWGGTKESVHESLTLFRQLREHGVSSHYWV